jgi:hypothetical protein
MDQGTSRMQKLVNSTKGNTGTTKSVDTVNSRLGKRHMLEISKMITNMGMESYIKTKNANTKVIGSMESNLSRKNNKLTNSLKDCIKRNLSPYLKNQNLQGIKIKQESTEYKAKEYRAAKCKTTEYRTTESINRKQASGAS